MPGLRRSSQVLMSLGLPLRTTKATTEVVTRPSVRRRVPVGGDLAGVDEARHVGLGRERDDVGSEAGLDGARLVAGGAVGRLEADVSAVRGLLEVGDDLVVDDLGRGVRDERERRRRVAAAAHVGAAGLVGGAAASGQGRERDEREQCGEGLAYAGTQNSSKAVGYWGLRLIQHLHRTCRESGISREGRKSPPTARPLPFRGHERNGRTQTRHPLAREPGRDGRPEGARAPTCGRSASASRRGSRSPPRAARSTAT